MNLSDWMPTSFKLGPPLPRTLGILWPWRKAEGPTTPEIPPEPPPDVVVVPMEPPTPTPTPPTPPTPPETMSVIILDAPTSVTRPNNAVFTLEVNVPPEVFDPKSWGAYFEVAAEVRLMSEPIRNGQVYQDLLSVGRTRITAPTSTVKVVVPTHSYLIDGAGRKYADIIVPNGTWEVHMGIPVLFPYEPEAADYNILPSMYTGRRITVAG